MTKMKRIKTIHYGIGSIGTQIVRLAWRRRDIEIVGATDIDQEKARRDLGQVAGTDEALGITVSRAMS